VRAAFDLSHRQLSQSQARLFRLLPINPGPDIGTEAAAQLVQADEYRTETLLQELHRAHLIEENTEGRWRMHDLIRLYATEQPHIQPDEPDAARQRLFTHYLGATKAANTHLQPPPATVAPRFPTRVDALAWLEAERLNLIAVCTDAGQTTTSIELTFALGRFLNFRRYFDDWITITTTARNILHQTGNRHGQGTALNNLGLALQQVRRFEEAITAHTQAATIYQETGDRHGEGQALGNLGLALEQVRRFEEARRCWRQAVEAFTDTADNDSMAMVQQWLDDLPPSAEPK
jgi:tetratricopeptide (TPR) repeat protein